MTAPQIPTKPAGLDQDSLFAAVFWHQRWQMFDGIYTPGHNSVEEMCADLSVPMNLTGKRVLDIGAWNGCLAFECERRGALEVVALSPEAPDLTGFFKIRDAIGSTRTRYVRGSAYDLDPAKLGHFDIVFFCGVLYHLRYPLLGIDNIRRVCTGEVFTETFVSDSQFLVKKRDKIEEVPLARISPVLETVPVWQFFRGDELAEDASNWFGPNVAAVVEAFESAGFETRILKRKTRGRSSRAMFHSRRKPGPPEFLTISTSEGMYYDTVVRHLLGKKSDLELGVRSEIERLLIERMSHENNEPNVANGNGKLLGDAPANVVTGSTFRASLVKEYYRRFLRRPAADQEVIHWVVQLERGTTHEEVLSQFVSSDEYFNMLGRDVARWLDAAINDLLGANSDIARDGWAESLASGTVTRLQVALQIASLTDCRQHLFETLYKSHITRECSELCPS